MGEKLYKTVNGAGAAAVASGIVVLVTGLVTGVIMIIAGAKLLIRKNSITI